MRRLAWFLAGVLLVLTLFVLVGCRPQPVPHEVPKGPPSVTTPWGPR